MDEIRATALAYYEKLPQPQKQQAQEFFRSMDGNRDGKVDLQDYITGLKQLGLTTVANIGFFKELDKNGNGCLDFDEVKTLFYLIQSGRFVFCGGCGEFLKGVHFTCVDCFDNSTATSFHLCCSCYQNNNFQHHGGAVFVDNYELLQSKRPQQASPISSTQASSISTTQAFPSEPSQSQEPRRPEQASQGQPPPSKGKPQGSKRKKAKKAAKSMLGIAVAGLNIVGTTLGIYEYMDDDDPNEADQTEDDQLNNQPENQPENKSDSNY
ncbi:hypothetical protein DITRI_Ditri08aG0029500 [Diplodiscus trichospermus]